MVNLRARYYNPAIGVFTGLDPLEGGMGQPMSLNRYGYVQGNVVNKVDPSGLCSDNDAVCNTEVQKLESEFPTVYIYWPGRPGQTKYNIFPMPTLGPTMAPCATPNPTATPGGPTVTPTPNATPSSATSLRIAGNTLATWVPDDIVIIHEALNIYQKARNLPLFNVPFVKVNYFDVTKQGGQTFYGNYAIHPNQASFYIGLGGAWSNSAYQNDRQYRKWIVVHELNHGLLYSKVGNNNYLSIGRRAGNTFVRPDPSKPVFPTKYSQDWDSDRPEYLVDSMTGVIWDITGEPSPQAPIEKYVKDVKDIMSQDGSNVSLYQWILSNVPEFVASQTPPTPTQGS